MRNQLTVFQRIRYGCAVPACARWVLGSLFLLLVCGAASAQINAAFTVNTNSGCSPVVVQFTDQSTGGPVSWKWNFGDGSPIVTLQNPEKIYTTPGTYNVSLTVSNGVDSSVLVKMAYITVFQSPVVNFAVSRNSGCFPLSTSFTDQSSAGSGSITKWLWDFGDGDTSSAQNPSYTYHSSGNFNISLVVTNSDGCISGRTKPSFVDVTGGVTAAFSTPDSTSCSAPLNTSFNNLTTGPATLSYQWNFGDGTTSIATSPPHTYNATGNYTVTLISTSTSGCADTLKKSNLISIASFNSNFTVPPGCQGAPLTFLNTTNPVPSSSIWYFSDGTVINGANATKTFPAAGNFSVKLVNTFAGGCTDSVSKPFTIAASPVAGFSSPDTVGCSAPFATSFKDQSLNAATWTWNFGDGTNANQQNPNHTYNSLGLYNVKLIVANAAGCTDSMTRSNYINVSQPLVSFTPVGASGCVPLFVQFKNTSTSSDPITGYFWNFGDGTTSTLQNPSHTYSSQGNFTVKLVITTASGCSDSLVSNAAVSAGTPATVNFTATPTRVCPATQVQFTNTSSAGSIFLWEFGDGTESSVENPQHLYSSDTGYFNVTLIVNNQGCTDSLVQPKFIYVMAPIAGYTANRTCAAPFQISFLDHSIGATTWNWTFGDGQSSTLQSPSHTYAAPGTYTVTETVSNGTCTSVSANNYQIIKETPDFSAIQTTVCHGSIVHFMATGLDSSNISGYFWNFGDGTVANEPGPSVTKSYADTGLFNVQLVITDKNGCTDSVTRPDFVKIIGPKAAFTTSGALCQNQTVNFTDQSTTAGGSSIVQWSWVWGDGGSSLLPGPPFAHTYPVPNSYSVSLKVTDNAGCSDSTSVPVTVGANKAAFTIPDSQYCTGQPLPFTNLSTGTALNYLWTFGDGTSSISEDPSHVYTQDSNFIIKLVISNASGCTDSATAKLSTGTVKAGFDFPASYTTTCPPLIATLDNSSTYYTKSFWEFGDGGNSVLDTPTHVYIQPGTYNITLVVTSPGGCQDSVTKSLFVKGPTGSFTSSLPQAACGPLSVSLNAASINAVEYSWDFGDGVVSPLSPSNTITHNYSATGSYFPKLILEDSTGCKVSYPGNVHIIIDQLTANFGLSPDTICDSGTVLFQDSSTSFSASALGQPSIYHWNFATGNPGDTANIPNPSFFYNVPGTFNPALTVTTPYGCTQTVSKSLLVTPSTLPLISGPDSACAGSRVSFTGSTTGGGPPVASWSWKFGNGDSSALQNPPALTYSSTGTYTVSLTATNINGCSETTVKTFLVNGNPVVNAGPVPAHVCLGQNVQLQSNDGVTYQWTPALGLSSTTISNPVASTESTTLYHVLVTNGSGCSATDSVLVTVTLPFVMTAGPDTTVCSTHPVPLVATPGISNYTWTPAAGLSNPSIYNPVAVVDTDSRFQVVGTDADGCFSDTTLVTIHVNPLPQVSAGPNQTVTVGSVIQLNATATGIITSWQWEPPDFLSCTTCAGPVATPKSSELYTVLATNNFGCTDSASVTVHLICAQGVVFIPNTFTPNGDGMNDVFYPRGRGVKTVHYFRVFNRWGELIFERDNFNINDVNFGWDGTYKGRLLNPDVFTYVTEMVCDNNETFMIKGNITLLR